MCVRVVSVYVWREGCFPHGMRAAFNTIVRRTFLFVV
jgi:hypothetical protein